MSTQPARQRWSSNKRNERTFAPVFGLFLGIFLFTAGHAFSADLIWNNATFSSSWNTTDANWSGALWANDATTPSNAVFGASGAGAVYVTEPLIAQDVIITGEGYSFASSAVENTLRIKGVLSNTVDVAWQVFLTNSLTKTGAGALNIQQIEIYTGATVINGGMVNVDGMSGMLYNGANNVTAANTIRINSGGTLSIGGPIGNGAGTALGKVQPSTNTFIINGGTWQHAGASNVKSSGGAGRLFSIYALGATLDSATAGSEFSLGYRYDFQAPGVIGSTVGGTLTLTGAGDGDLNYQLRGTGGLIKQGLGTWKLSNVNTYSGPTVIEEGTLALVNAAAVSGAQGVGSISSPSITISNGATLDVSGPTGGFTLSSSQSLLGLGTIVGLVNTASGAKIYGGLEGSYGTNTFASNLNLASGALCYLDLGTAAGGSNDRLVVQGDLNLSNPTFHLTAPSAAVNLDSTTDYVLIEVAGTLSGSPNATPVWEVAPLNAADFQILVVGNDVVLRSVTGTPPAVAGSATPSSVNHFDPVFVSVTATPGSSPISSVVLNASAVGASGSIPLVSAGGNVYTNTIIVGATAPTGTNVLLVTATDTGFLAGGANIPVEIVGRNRVWNGLGSTGDWSVNPNWVDAKGPGTSGDGVTFAGTDQLTNVMDANYSLTDLTFASTAGQFVITGSGTTLTLEGSVTNLSTNTQTLKVPIALTGTPTFDASAGSLVLGSTIAQNTAGLTKTGTNALILLGQAKYNGITTVASGSLWLTNGAGKMYQGSPGGALLINSGATVGVVGGVGWGGVLGFLTVMPEGCIINGGTLRHTGNSNQQNDGGTGSARAFTVGALGATIDSATAGQTFSLGFRTDTRVVGSTDGGTLTLAGAGDGVLEYSLPGSGGLTKIGSGTWTMSGTNNTYTGNTTVSEGTLVINLPFFAASSTVTVATNALLNLAFVDATNLVNGLVLGGVSKSAGVYDATTDPTYLAGTGKLQVTTYTPPIPTTPTNLVWSVSGTNLTFSWPMEYTGWSLLTQTNNLSQGISSNTNDWMVVPGSTTTNLVTIPVNKTTPAGFYRMVH